MGTESFMLLFDGDDGLNEFEKAYREAEGDCCGFILGHVKEFLNLGRDDEAKIIGHDNLSPLGYVLSERIRFTCIEYEYHGEERYCLQKEFETLCRRLKCDISTVQPTFNELTMMLKMIKFIKGNGKDDDDIKRPQVLEDKIEELSKKLEDGIGWKHAVGLHYGDWDVYTPEQYSITRDMLEAFSDGNKDKDFNGFALIQGCLPYQFDS